MEEGKNGAYSGNHSSIDTVGTVSGDTVNGQSSHKALVSHLGPSLLNWEFVDDDSGFYFAGQLVEQTCWTNIWSNILSCWLLVEIFLFNDQSFRGANQSDPIVLSYYIPMDIQNTNLWICFKYDEKIFNDRTQKSVAYDLPRSQCTVLINSRKAHKESSRSEVYCGNPVHQSKLMSYYNFVHVYPRVVSPLFTVGEKDLKGGCSQFCKEAEKRADLSWELYNCAEE